MGRKVAYVREGQWFAVPVYDGQYALGLVIRVSSIGIGMISTFFDVISDDPEGLMALLPLDQKTRMFSRKHGHLGFKLKTWVPLNMNPEFCRDRYPLPLYRQYGRDDVFRQAVLIVHPETLQPMTITEYYGTDYDKMTAYGAAGHGFIEQVLERWLSPNCEDLQVLRS